MVRTLLAITCVGLATLAPSAAQTGSQEPPGPRPAPAPAVNCLEQLASLPWCELEQLYRQSAPGQVPHGFARGRVVYCPAERFADARARATRLLWHGKHFHDDMLINQWLLVRAIRARISLGPSWLDGKDSLILDYACESRVWSDVRDEMREVAPGLYVGAMYLRRCPEPHLKLFFCLEAHCR